MLEFNTKAKLLDCGCWDGVHTTKYGELIGSKYLYGIETYIPKVKEANKKGIIAKQGDLNNKLSFPDEFFDVVVANHVIEHLVNVKGFVSEIFRVLKKNGYVIIGTPNLASWHNVFALLIGVQPFSGPTILPNYSSDVKMVADLNKKRIKELFSEYIDSFDHIKVMTAKTLVNLFSNNKFKIESLNGFGYYPFIPMISRPLSKIDPSHSHYVILKARKK